jgi:hypothetical protein
MRGREQMTHLRLAIGRHREARLALLGAEMGGPASRQCRETPVSPNHRTPARPLHSAVKHEEAHRGAHQQRALGRHPRGDVPAHIQTRCGYSAALFFSPRCEKRRRNQPHNKGRD